MTTQTSVKQRIFNVLTGRRVSKNGMTTATLARMARTNIDNIRKRVYELRLEGHDILSNRADDGKVYYRLQRSRKA